MSIFATLLLGCLISYSTSSNSDLFSQEDSLSPYYDDSDVEGSENEDYEPVDNEAEPYKVNSATVTYDKSEYLGDMMKEYFGKISEPPPHIYNGPEPEPEEADPDPPKPGGKSRTNVGGFGKIDISIQYGCCASSKNEHAPPPPPPPPPQPTTTPRPLAPGSRFRMPPPGLMGFPGYYEETPAGYPGPIFAPADFKGPEYMSQIPPKPSKRTYEEPSFKKNKHETTKQDNKHFYIQHNSNNNNNNNNNPPKQQQKPPPPPPPPPPQHQQPKQQHNNNHNNVQNHHSTYSRQTENPNYTYQPKPNYMYPSSSMASYPSPMGPWPSPTEPARRSPAPASTPRPYTTQSNSYKRYNYDYEPTTMSPTTPMTTTTKMNYFESKNPVVLAQEQFYSIQPPQPFFPSTMSPMSPLPLPIPAERSSFYTSERLLSPMNLYGGYLPPGMSLPVQRRYYQGFSVEKPQLPPQDKVNSGTSKPEPTGMYYMNHVTPRSVFNDVSKIVIRDVPQSDLYPVQPASFDTRRVRTPQHPQQHQQQQQHQQKHQQQPQQPQPKPQTQQQQWQQQQQQRVVQPPASYASMSPVQQYAPDQQHYTQDQQQQRNYPSEQQPRRYEEDREEVFPAATKTQAVSNGYENKMAMPSMQATSPPVAPAPPPASLNQPTAQDVNKNREMFLNMQTQAYQLFVEAALADFKTILNKGIEEKKIEVLDEEKTMLESNEFNKEIGLSILDFLTVYERYSNILDNKDLSGHIMQDMDRAKEYLTMKLNKFWLELDGMETQADFLEKKNYYKTREKPTGIMNIFYEWYEKMTCKPAEIDLASIKTQLLDIMKKERRYWLLLL